MNLFNFLTGSRPPLVEQSMTDLGVMLDTADSMFAAATNSLLDNEPLHVDLSTQDDIINEREQTIRRSVLEHILADPRAELSLSLLLVSIVQDAERLGDLAKSIAKAADLASSPRMGRHVEALREIRDRVQSAFPRVRRSFIVGDAKVGRVVMDEHAQTKIDVGDFLQRLAVVLSISARMIGRTSSHLSNIVSAVALPFDQVRNAPNWADND